MEGTFQSHTTYPATTHVAFMDTFVTLESALFFFVSLFATPSSARIYRCIAYLFLPHLVILMTAAAFKGRVRSNDCDKLMVTIRASLPKDSHRLE